MKISRDIFFLRAPAMLLLLLSGCAIGPDFSRPSPETPEQFRGQNLFGDEKTGGVRLEGEKIGKWWETFQDETLTALLQRAFVENVDLLTAESRIREARGGLLFTTAGLFPQVNVTGTYRRNKNANPVVGGASFNSGGSSNSTGSIRNLFQSGFDSSWEIDVFGGLRREREAAAADTEAAEEDLHNVFLTLAAEVSQNYLQLRGTQQRLRIAEATLKSQQRAAELMRTRFEVGFVSKLDLANAEAQAATTAAQIPRLRAEEQKFIFALSTLLAMRPFDLDEELKPRKEIPLLPPEIPVGVPSDLLRRRPDIRQAEAALHAATARVGSAESDYFPKFSLTGTFGYNGDKASAIGKGSNRFWSYGSSVSWPIFDAGRIAANVEIQNARQEQALLAYRGVVLNAFREIESALTDYVAEWERSAALQESVTQNELAFTLAKRLYEDGNTDYLNVITAERSFFTAQDTLVQSRQTIATNLVSIYKALGGGWESVDEESVTQ